MIYFTVQAYFPLGAFIPFITTSANLCEKYDLYDLFDFSIVLFFGFVKAFH